MTATAYFLPPAIEDPDLAVWAAILPKECRVLRANLFGDLFLLDSSGAVYLFDRGGLSAERIAETEEEFWREVRHDPQGWQLRPLADECYRSGKVLTAEQCYAFTTLPALGGDYSIENVWVAPQREWFSFTANLFQQLEARPDGAVVSVKVED